MDLPFDTEKTDTTLEETRAREEEDVARILSDKYGMPYADLSITEIDSDALRLIPEEDARAAETAAFAKAGRKVSLAVHNPSNPDLARIEHTLADRGYETVPHLVSSKSLARALDFYKELSFSTESQAGVLSFSNIDETVSKLYGPHATKQMLRKELDLVTADRSPNYVSRLFETLLAGALALKASDIHLEPREESTLLRLRIDGLLTDAYAFDPDVSRRLNARIKLLSGAKMNVSDRAQDGRFTIARADGEIEMRTSFIPGNFGESIVMRILDPRETQLPFKELGIHPKLLARLNTEIHRQNGMLLNTGPTGSGKTTTLYAFLREVYAPEVKIITIEDPIEYHLPGIVQTQVEPKKYTFAEGMRSIVRQDPDIIMIGEIRDSDTADIAIQAALTGHFVFSTLHTNDAAGTFQRLVDLGADPNSFGSAISVAMAQRLLRTLHPETKQERPLTDEEKRMIDKVFEPLADKSLIPEKIETVWDAVPSDKSETGYKGRIGLYEAIFMDDALADALRDNPPAHEVARLAEPQGYLTMAQDGILKALQGVTSLDEVRATVDLPRV